MTDEYTCPTCNHYLDTPMRELEQEARKAFYDLTVQQRNAAWREVQERDDRIDALEAALDVALRASKQRLEERNARIDRETLRAERLLAALRLYGRHWTSCAGWLVESQTCSCGLKDALKGLTN